MGTDWSPGNPCWGRDVRPRSLKATYQELTAGSPLLLHRGVLERTLGTL